MKNPSARVFPLSQVMNEPLSIRKVAFPGPVTRRVSFAGELNVPNTEESAFSVNEQGVFNELQDVSEPLPPLQPWKVLFGSGVPTKM